jgi:hypothetical protein
MITLKAKIKGCNLKNWMEFCNLLFEKKDLKFSDKIPSDFCTINDNNKKENKKRIKIHDSVEKPDEIGKPTNPEKGEKTVSDLATKIESFDNKLSFC